MLLVKAYKEEMYKKGKLQHSYWSPLLYLIVIVILESFPESLLCTGTTI